MGLIVPSSKKKRYLSGFDWVMGVTDYIIKERTCAGNISQVVIVLDSQVDELHFRNSLSLFAKEFPVLYGTIARDINLAPYWKIPKKLIRKELDLNVYHIENSSDEKSNMSLLEGFVNKPFKSKDDHIAFHLISAKKGDNYLAVTFDHLLFDAIGAELFINLFQKYVSQNHDNQVTQDISLNGPADLCEWKNKFYAGRVVNRKLVSLSKTPISSIPLPDISKKKSFKFKLFSFSKEISEKIYDNMYKEAGYLMEMPYLFAIVVHTIHVLYRRELNCHFSYVVPVSVDMRTSEDKKIELFFNHTSMLFFQIPVESVTHMSTLIKVIKEQFYEQVQSRFPEKLLEASALLRIAPFSFLGKIFHLPLEGKIASFCFSHVSKNSYSFREFMKSEIKNMFHMPRVPVPPGIGIFFNSFNGQLNTTITWLDGLLDDEKITLLEKELKRRLLKGVEIISGNACKSDI